MSHPRDPLVVLGSGTPVIDPARSGPSVAVIVEGQSYLVDFGPGVVRRAAAASAEGLSGLTGPDLRLAFLTHLHSDHTVGYPDLILSPWVEGRTAPLEVFGPKGLDQLTRHVLMAYQQDIAMRRYGPEPANDHRSSRTRTRGGPWTRVRG